MSFRSLPAQSILGFPLFSLAVSHFQNHQQEPCPSHVYEEPQAHHRHHHRVHCECGAWSCCARLNPWKLQTPVAVLGSLCAQLCLGGQSLLMGLCEERVKGLGNQYCREWLGWLSLEKRRLGGTFWLYEYLEGGCDGVGIGLLSQASGEMGSGCIGEIQVGY